MKGWKDQIMEESDGERMNESEKVEVKRRR